MRKKIFFILLTSTLTLFIFCYLINVFKVSAAPIPKYYRQKIEPPVSRQLGPIYQSGGKCYQSATCTWNTQCGNVGDLGECPVPGEDLGPYTASCDYEVSCPGCSGCQTAPCGECSSDNVPYKCVCSDPHGDGTYGRCEGVKEISCCRYGYDSKNDRCNPPPGDYKCDITTNQCKLDCVGSLCGGSCTAHSQCQNWNCGGQGQICCSYGCNSGLSCCDTADGKKCQPTCGTNPPPTDKCSNYPGYSCNRSDMCQTGTSIGQKDCPPYTVCCKYKSGSSGCEIYGMTKCSCSDPNYSKRAPNGDCCCPTPPSGPSYSCTCTLKANPNPIPSGQNTTYITAESKPDSRVPGSDFGGCQVSYYVREYGLPKQVTKILPATITQDENTMTYNGSCMYFVYVGSQAYNYDCTCDVTVTKGTTAPTVSCSASPNPANVGQTVTWTATSSNFSGTPTYTWSGAVTGTGASLTTSYSNPGTSTATIVASYGTQTATSSCSVSIIPPDLIIDTLSANPSSPSQGATFTVTVKEKNIGQGRAGQHILKVIDEDGVEVFTKTIDNLDSGATTPSYTFNHTCVYSGETKIYTAKADSGNQIAESNENNNEKTLTVVCPGLCHSAALELTKNNTCPDGSVNVSGGTVSLKLTQNNGTTPYIDTWHCYKGVFGQPGAQEISCGFSPQIESTNANTVNKNNLKWWSGTGTYSAFVSVEDSSFPSPCPSVATNVVLFTVSSCPEKTKCNTSTYKCDTSGTGPDCNTGSECCSRVYGSDYQCTTGACQSDTDKGQTFCPSGQTCCIPTTPAKWVCNTTTWRCDQSSTGPYDSKGACENECKPFYCDTTNWRCYQNKSPLSPLDTGPYGSSDVCSAACVSPPCTIISFDFKPSKIFLSQTTTASWSTDDCTNCEASCGPAGCGDWSGSKLPSDSQSVKPTAVGTYKYRLTCWNDNNTTFQERTVEVYNAPIWREVAPKLGGYLWGIVFGK